MFFDLSNEPMDHPKRSATVSFRCPPDHERRLQAIANATGVTLSDLLYHVTAEYTTRWESAYLQLKHAFEANPDKPEKSTDEE